MVPKAKQIAAILLVSYVLAGCSAVGRVAPKKPPADLPDLLTFQNGRKVKTSDDWRARREEIRQLMLTTFTGTVPEETPKIISAEILQECRETDGSVRREVRVTLATPGRLAFKAWVWRPAGDGPFPVLLTAPRYYQIGWANEALKRGYIVCLYPGVDSHHEEKDYPGYESMWEGFQKEYPQASWCEIVVKSWLASRCVDYLLDERFGYPVAKGQIGVVGFSRYGKQSLIAAALDERITCVVARSAGAGGSAPYRFNGRESFGEACCDFAGHWFLENLRSYSGRENELPFDAHGWLGLIAPRHCLLDTAYNDDGDPTFAVERGYLQGREVYRLLGHKDSLCLDYRSGGHETQPAPNPITPERYQRNLDWFDLAFGRGTATQKNFPEKLLHDFNWQDWRKKQRHEDIIPLKIIGTAVDKQNVLRQKITWILGQKPETIEGEGAIRFFTDEEDRQMGHDRWEPKGTARVRVSFGAGIPGNIYYNPKIKEPVATVIWLHPFSYGSGYNEGYGVEDTTIYHELARQGYVVLAYDQCGFGLRLLEGRDFYDRYPHWSRLGRMIYDARCAVDFLAEGKGQTQGKLPVIDKNRIFVLGYSMGGMVGLYTAAMDSRIAGVASFCGFTPMRNDTDASPTGGVRRWWQWHSLMPKLGLYNGRETELPYDYDEVLSLIAPRPCLIVSPTRDRQANHQDVVQRAESARHAWLNAGHAKLLSYICPDDINRFQKDQQQMFSNWLRDVMAANH